MFCTKIKRCLAEMIEKLCRVGAGDWWPKTAYRLLCKIMGWKCENLETIQNESWTLYFTSNVSAGNVILCREQRVERTRPPYSKQNYSSALNFEVGSWSFRNVGTYLPNLTPLRPIGKLGYYGPLSAPWKPLMRYGGWRCVGHILSILANQQTKELTEGRRLALSR